MLMGKDAFLRMSNVKLHSMIWRMRYLKNRHISNCSVIRKRKCLWLPNSEESAQKIKQWNLWHILILKLSTTIFPICFKLKQETIRRLTINNQYLHLISSLMQRQSIRCFHLSLSRREGDTTTLSMIQQKINKN